MNPNPMSELKAKDCACPICSAPADTFPTRTKRKARCSNGNCDLASYAIDLSQWNNRPRERELEGVLKTTLPHMACERYGDFFFCERAKQAKCRCSACNAYNAALSSINAVLGKGGE